MALVHAGPAHSRKIPTHGITTMSDDGCEEFYDAPAMPESDQPENVAPAAREPPEPEDFRGGRAPRYVDSSCSSM
jgi:hypothetical protein